MAVGLWDKREVRLPDESALPVTEKEGECSIMNIAGVKYHVMSY